MKNLRKTQKINKLQDLLKELKDKHLLESEPASVLENCFDGEILEFLKNELQNQDRAKKGRRYSDTTKQFAMTLHYYSPQAYEYCSKIMSLPSVSALRHWLSNIDCSPGFLDNIIERCAASGEKDYSLVFDSMSIKKQIQYDQGSYKGFVDYGGLIGEETDKWATEALVFLLVPLKGPCIQYPIGYFFVDKVKTTVQRELVNTALILTAEKGIKIRNLTSDGAMANQSMFTALGANMDVSDEDATYSFKHPTLEHNVYCTLDICHMLKLGRNALADMGIFKTKAGEKISWQFIKQLTSLQDDIGLRLGNKLTSRHTQYHKAKMKVQLAAQVFSTSVADSMEYLKQAGVDGFKDCDATIEFVRQVSKNFILSQVTDIF